MAKRLQNTTLAGTALALHRCNPEEAPQHKKKLNLLLLFLSLLLTTLLTAAYTSIVKGDTVALVFVV